MTVVVDTSVLAAVVFGEPDAEVLTNVLARAAGDLSISAVTAVEAGIVVESKQGPAAGDDLRALLTHLGVRTVPVDADQALAAVAAWRRFGKGRHPAALNLGDCFSYALARTTGATLPSKGGDFSQTDIPSAL